MCCGLLALSRHATGEHWGCPYAFAKDRLNAPFQCKALANVAVANVLANTLCNEAMGTLEWRAPGIDAHYEQFPRNGTVDWEAVLRRFRAERERKAGVVGNAAAA